MRKLLIPIATWLLLAGAAPTEAANHVQQNWPAIEPTQRIVHLQNGTSASYEMDIYGVDKKPLYKLACHTFLYDGDPDFDYSGDFECRLKSLYSSERYSTLLTDDPHQFADWDSRGRFLLDEVTGKCADYPEFGLTRHFRLRGMLITLSIHDLKIQNNDGSNPQYGNLKQLFGPFVFDVKVALAPEALSSIAEPVPYLRPPRVHPKDKSDLSLDCRVVMKSKSGA